LARPRHLRAAAWGVVVLGAAAPLIRRRARLKPPVVAVAAYAAPVALCVATRRTRARDVGTCLLHMWAYIAMYEMPNDDPERLQRRVRVRYPVLVDRAIGLGELPGVRLQKAMSRPGTTTGLEGVLVWAHWLWFFFPHVLLVPVMAVVAAGFVAIFILPSRVLLDRGRGCARASRAWRPPSRGRPRSRAETIRTRRSPGRPDPRAAPSPPACSPVSACSGWPPPCSSSRRPAARSCTSPPTCSRPCPGSSGP